MIISKLSMQIYTTLFTAALLYQADVKAADNGNDTLYSRSKFIEVGTGYEYSDNIYKRANDEQSGSTVLADIELGYEQQRASNEIALNYYAEYTDQSKNPLENSSYWIGKSKISQDLFSENLLFNLTHTRQRYIVDQTQTALDSNQDERDLLTGGLQWLIPYSSRTTFILGVTHTQTWFKEETSNNNNTNAGEVSWQYALDEISQVQLSYVGSENKFDDFDYTYTEHNLDARLTRQYLLGTYSLNIGGNWIDTSSEQDNSQYSGQHYGLTIDAQIRRHLFLFNASRIVTNTSEQTGTDDELDFSDNQLFWRTNVSLQQQYTILDERLLSTIRLYYENDDAIASIDSSDTGDQDRYGAFGELTWSFTEKLSANVSLNYYNANLSSGDTRKFLETEIGTSYNINNSIYIQFTASFEKQNNMQSSSGYEEQNYATRIAFRY